MKKAALMEMLIREARAYRAGGIENSLKRNAHLYECDPDYGYNLVSQCVIDAVLTDYLNFLATKQGINLVLHSRDLRDTDK